MSTDVMPESAPETTARELLSSWLQASFEEGAARAECQEAEAKYQVARTNAAAIAAKIGTLVDCGTPRRYFRTGFTPSAMDTVVEVYYNAFDTTRPRISIIKVETA